MKLSSPAFKEGGMIPARYTCDGENVSPPLAMYLKVFVTPSARREEVRERGTALAIAVRESAQGNRANTRVREIVAARFALPLSAVRIMSGHTSRAKMLSIRD